MRLLLDTHVFLALVELGSVTLPHRMLNVVSDEQTELVVSVASLWEIAIKERKGKLGIKIPLSALPDLCVAASASILPISSHHVLNDVEPEPATRDPFDRLLLAQAQVEGLLLVTLDHALVDHPLTWKA
jgi:PIN domain nuclease of toxin-antitoxin system